MTKRGQCRCGTIITFVLTSQGYKTRCPVCQSVVRLRVDPASPTAQPHLAVSEANAAAKRPEAATVPPAVSSPVLPSNLPLPPPLPTDCHAQEVADNVESNGTPDFSVLTVRKSSAPSAQTEMEAFHDEPAPELAATGMSWWMMVAIIAAIVVAGGGAAMLWG
jgi:hypothetical protein